MPEKTSMRAEIYAVHEGCLTRPYVQLQLPLTVTSVRSLELSVKSRDQGWGGGGGKNPDQPSNTWHEVHIQRSPDYPGRSHTNGVKFYRNPIAVAEFGHYVCRWDHESSPPYYREWIASILPGDTIQIIPKAFGQGWTNIISEASIKIEYDEGGHDGSVQSKVPSIPGFVGTNTRYPDTLDSSKKQIRLLLVLPGSFHDPIIAHFETISLLESERNTLPEFWSLSYCWGELTKMAELTLNSDDGTGRRFLVPQNVANAIRRLRHLEKPLKIWIDAICINQRDAVERSEQVAMMNSVYQSAAEVHIWLGEEHYAANSSLQIIRDICNITNVQSDACPGSDRCSCPAGWKHRLDRDAYLAACDWDPETIPVRHMNAIFEKHLEYFADEGLYAPDVKNNPHGLAVLASELFGHPWFWRVWVLQEATLARRAILHCSTEMIGWKDLMKVHRWLDSPDYKFSFWVRHFQPQVRMPPIWTTLDRTQEAEQVSGRSERTTPHNEGGASTEDQPSTPSLAPIIDIFLNALDLSSSDPRDKLYALLPFGKETSAMMNHLPAELQPDYKKPVGQVYADFTRWWIRQHNSLEILSMIHSQSARTWNCMLCDSDCHIKAPATLPTWTVSPEGHANFIYSNLNSKFSFRAGSTTVPDRQLLDNESDPLALRVTGYEVGSILAKGYPPLIISPTGCGIMTTPTRKNIVTKSVKVVHTGVGIPLYIIDDIGPFSNLRIERVFETMLDPCYLDYFQRGLLSRPADPGKNLTNGWTQGDANGWMTRYADHLKSHIAYFPEHIKRLPVLSGKTEPCDKSEVKENSRLNTTFIHPCLSDCYFIGSNGIVGLCPWAAKEGDLIVLLHGATVPYLLRPARNTGLRKGSDELEEEREKFELVGECFVEGIMNGELMERKLRNRESPQKFVLV